MALESLHLKSSVQFLALHYQKCIKVLECVQRKATELVKCLEHKSHEELLGEQRVLSPEERKLRGDHVTLYKELGLFFQQVTG